MVSLYLMTIEDVARIPESVCRQRFPLRFERAERYRFQEDRLRCLGAGLLLSEVLNVREADLCTGPQGKLFLPEGGCRFNLSHSGDYVVLAVSDDEVGVDIEKMDDRHLDVAKRVFREEELKWMEEDPVRRFFCLWTLKESVMKLCGKGLSLPPESFSALGLLEGGEIEIDSMPCHGHTFDVIPGYGLSVCCEKKFKQKLFRVKPKNTSVELVTCRF